MLQTLRSRRIAKGFTVLDMAKLLNLKSASTYSKKEREDISINVNEAQKICMILNCSMNDIFLTKNYLNKIENSND